MTTRTVSRALDYLKSAGWLEVLPRTYEHGGHTYKLNLVKLNPGNEIPPDKMSARRGPSPDKMSSGEPSQDKMSSHDAEVHQTFTTVDQTFSTVDQTFWTSPPDISCSPLIKNHQEPPKPPRRSSAFVLPEWVPAESWNHFIEMRTSMHKKPTEHAVKLLVDKLDKLRISGQNPCDVLDQSTANGWTGIFPLKGNGNGNLPVGKADGVMAVLTESIRDGERKNRTGAHGLLSAGGDGQDDA
jgi:hypothetical protein